MTIYSEDKDGNIIITFDSRWRHPETLGYNLTDPEYAELQKLWEKAIGETVPEEANADPVAEVLYPTD